MKSGLVYQQYHCLKLNRCKQFAITGIRNPLVREFHKAVVVQNKAAFVEYLEPEQLAMSVAGGGKLVFSIHMLAEERRD